MATTNQWAGKDLDKSLYGNLGRTFKTIGFDANWNGSGENSTAAMIAGIVSNSPELMSKFGLSSYDLKKISDDGYSGDSYDPEQWQVSDKAREALSGLTWNRTGYAGVKDGRSTVIRDAQGNIIFAGKPYSYDPAGDLKDAAIKGVGFMAAAYGAAQLFGLEGAAGRGMLQGIPAMTGDFGAIASAGNTAFDTVVSLTGSEVLAGAASKAAGAVASGADWLSSTWSAITGGGAGSAAAGAAKSAIGSYFSGSSLLRDLLPIIGAGVNQMNVEKMAEDQRNWQSAERQKDRDFEEKKASDTRRRQMPTTGPGLLGKFRVIPGAGNGG